MLSNLGSLAGMAGGASAVKSQEEMYVAFLKSRPLQDGIVKKYKLKERYKVETYEDARRKLNDKLSINGDKRSGLIYVDVDDRDPNIAAQIANQHYSDMQELLSNLAITEAQKRRVYFEAQVQIKRKALEEAEKIFLGEKRSGKFTPALLAAESDFRQSMVFRAALEEKLIQSKVLAATETENSPRRKRLAEEISAIKAQLDSSENKNLGGVLSKEIGGKENHTKAERAFREMKVQEATLDVFLKQLEVARSDEAKDGPLLQQLEVAIVPEKPSKPKRPALFVAALCLASLIALICAVYWSYAHRSQKN